MCNKVPSELRCLFALVYNRCAYEPPHEVAELPTISESNSCILTRALLKYIVFVDYQGDGLVHFEATRQQRH